MNEVAFGCDGRLKVAYLVLCPSHTQIFYENSAIFGSFISFMIFLCLKISTKIRNSKGYFKCRRCRFDKGQNTSKNSLIGASSLRRHPSHFRLSELAQMQQQKKNKRIFESQQNSISYYMYNCRQISRKREKSSGGDSQAETIDALKRVLILQTQPGSFEKC